MFRQLHLSTWKPVHDGSAALPTGQRAGGSGTPPGVGAVGPWPRSGTTCVSPGWTTQPALVPVLGLDPAATHARSHAHGATPAPGTPQTWRTPVPTPSPSPAAGATRPGVPCTVAEISLARLQCARIARALGGSLLMKDFRCSARGRRDLGGRNCGFCFASLG